MMALLTGNRLPATTHRVVNPEQRDGGRLSMPFFLHPHPEAVLAPEIPGFQREVRARTFFHERLRAIGVEPPTGRNSRSEP
jgi:isopenicillin N synthase-like dioxygenase